MTSTSTSTIGIDHHHHNSYRHFPHSRRRWSSKTKNAETGTESPAATMSPSWGEGIKKEEVQEIIGGVVEAEGLPIEKGSDVIDEAARTVRSSGKRNGGRITPFLFSETKTVEVRKEGEEVVTESVDVPEWFVCPISKELMVDPVVVANGQTYDRPAIQTWLNSGNRTCPKTKQVLPHLLLTPNYLVREMISEWCKANDFQIPPHNTLDGIAITQGERIQLNSLLKKIISPSIHEKTEAAKELRHLTRHCPCFRALLGEMPGAISQLFSLLSSTDLCEHNGLQEDVVTTILNLSIHDNNKKIVADIPLAIPLLIEATKMGTISTRSNAAAAIFTLAALDENKLKIGELGGLKPLIELLGEDSPIAKKDAASAIFSLCLVHENSRRAVDEGAVRMLLICITECNLVDESLAILALLASNQEAVKELCDNDGLRCLLKIIRENECRKNQENAMVILYSVCMCNRSKLHELREEENCFGSISWLAENGTSRARRKAGGILLRLNRGKDSCTPTRTPRRSQEEMEIQGKRFFCT